MNGLTFMDPATLRHRITIETAAHTSDGLGGAVQNWVEWRTVWAHIEPIRADMQERASQTDEWVTHRIHVRQPLAIGSEMRLRKGTRTFEIEAIHDPDETGRYWVLTAREDGR